MSEQWYLDLDGVRSGPYQTSEVMSLVAEGEILPHHLIATELKSQKWTTILEWRLNQNKGSEPNKITAPATTNFSPVQEKPAPVETPKPVETKTTEAHTEKPIEIEVPNKVTKSPAHSPITPPPSPTTSPAKPAGKRDPMAEMFDILQNTKNKRETKSQQTHAQAHSHTQAHAHSPNLSSTAPAEKKAPSSNQLGKTILIGIVITIIGFALGQLFQKQKAPDLNTTALQSAPTATPKPTTSVVEAEPAENDAEETKIVDRSTDKMTIRAQVTPTPEHSKDIQELKDLKKELLELKALKDEIRSNNNDSGHMGSPSNSNPNDPNSPTMDGEMDEGNPDGAPGNDVHY
jgi:hypothetical protein